MCVCGGGGEWEGGGGEVHNEESESCMVPDIQLTVQFLGWISILLNF